MTAEAIIRDELEAAEDAIRRDLEDHAGEGVDVEDVTDEPNPEDL